jgi:hypothetical protein
MGNKDEDTYRSPVEKQLRTRQIFLPIPMEPDLAPMEQEEAEEEAEGSQGGDQ